MSRCQSGGKKKICSRDYLACRLSICSTCGGAVDAEKKKLANVIECHDCDTEYEKRIQFIAN